MSHKTGKLNELVIHAALFVYVASIILFSYSEGKSYITKIVAMGLVAVYIYTFYNRKQPIPIAREWLILLLWVIVSLLSIFFAIDFNLAVSKFITILQVFIISFMIYSLVYSVRNANSILLSLLLTVLIVSLLAYSNPAAYADTDGRLKATFNNANLYGLVLLSSIIISLGYLFSAKYLIFRIVQLPLILFFFIMLLQTGSRKAILGLFIVVTLFVYFKFREHIKRNVFVALLMLVVAVSAVAGGLYYLKDTSHFYRIQRVIDAFESKDISSAGESERGRLELYAKGLEVAMDNPVIGVGLDNFRRVDSGNVFSSDIGTYSHSNYIEVLVSTGIIGFVLYYSVYGLLLFRIYKLRKRNFSNRDKTSLIMVGSIFSMYILYDFAMVSYYEKVSWLIMALVLSVVGILENKKLDKVEKPAEHRDTKRNLNDGYSSVRLR